MGRPFALNLFVTFRFRRPRRQLRQPEQMLSGGLRKVRRPHTRQDQPGMKTLRLTLPSTSGCTLTQRPRQFKIDSWAACNSLNLLRPDPWSPYARGRRPNARQALRPTQVHLTDMQCHGTHLVSMLGPGLPYRQLPVHAPGPSLNRGRGVRYDPGTCVVEGRVRSSFYL